MTREDWLKQLTDKLRPVFAGAGHSLPEKIRTSCGFPSKGGLATKQRRIGEAWSDAASEDQTFETFVSPMVSDALEVAAIQVHELCHCAAGVECKHRKPFPACAKAVGLEGKMTATIAGDDLKSTLQIFIDEIGPYPHAKLVHSSNPKKQGTRMLKVECPLCGCVCRMTAKWLEQPGPPHCACGASMVPEEKPDDEADGS